MAKKEAYTLLFLALALLLIAISGCGKEEASCPNNTVMINTTCCYDLNSNSVCDLDEVNNVSHDDIPALCGNGVCETGENCTNCWKDCGACKKIVYKYVPRNFTLAELQADINDIERSSIKFRKDITSNSTVANLFYFDKTIPRYFAEFMDVKYKYLHTSRDILLSNTYKEEYYFNTSQDLLRYVNYSNWYIIYTIRNREMQEYENRIMLNRAKDDYPTQPTGYQKTQRYKDWEFKNHTKEEHVIFNNVTLLDNGMVESIYGSVTDYEVTYKIRDWIDENNMDNQRILEEFDSVEEIRLAYTHAMSFRCSKNLAVTVYTYDYVKDYYGEYYSINEENLRQQVKKNKNSLISRANAIKAVCDKEYTKEWFTYS